MGLSGFPSGRTWLAGLLALLVVFGAWPLKLAVAVAAEPDVGVRLTANKRVYARGERVKLTLEVVNRTSQPLTLRFPTAQRYDFVIQDAQGRDVWRWSTDRLFAQMLGEETLPPADGKLTYRHTVGKRLPPGRYTVIGSIPALGGPMSASTEIEVQ